jgi:hypothetical protein
MEPLGGVTITAREIYEAVIRLTGRVDVLIEQHADTRGDVKDHEERLRSLERARWPLPSLAAIISLIALGVGVLPMLTGS